MAKAKNEEVVEEKVMEETATEEVIEEVVEETIEEEVKEYEVTAPVKDFNGEVAGVQFAYGKAKVKAGWILEWFKEKGYGYEEVQ